MAIPIKIIDMRVGSNFLGVFTLILMVGCGSPKPILVDLPDNNGLDTVLTERRDLDTLFVSAPRIGEKDSEQETVPNELPDYNGSYQRTHDLLHTKLDLRFDWENESVKGKANLIFTPLFYPSKTLKLDAKNFQFFNVSFAQSTDTLKYTYDGSSLEIDLGKTFVRQDTFEIFIDYLAHPTKSGGSNAITSDQGLFFINADNSEPNKPQQIWTQGETEWNSKWFPTIDKPNERCTQEIALTVEDRFKTLSNGELVDSKKNKDGTRTDVWRMDQPHAPYLFMIAVGEYAVVKEEWEGIPVEYYVEPEYESSAKAIFAHTPEMLSFFSEKLGIKYPWNKYAQIVVRDYVAGAMENTTAVVFGDFVQKHAQELIDNGNDEIVAHELFHHWFGDYVTCESWANLTMNEGFATYSEYLWFEYKYGRDEADFHLLNEAGGYFSSSNGSYHPLIHFGYRDKEDMFDAHSYNKGGAVLHMLRKYVGDEAFWAGLNKYLNENAFQSVEMHNLRLAFEAVTGEDLNWFFNQWFLDQGHPILDINHDYNREEQMASLKVIQQQDPATMAPIFKLPVKVHIHLEDGVPPMEKEIVVNQREQVFDFKVPSKPKSIVFDAERMLLGQINYNRTPEEHKYLFRNSKRFLDRLEAINELGDLEEEGINTIKEAINDSFWYIRGSALQGISPKYLTLDLQESIRKLVVEDPHSQIRGLALNRLSEIDYSGIVELAKEVIDKEKVYNLVAQAFNILVVLDRDSALEYAKKLESIDNEEIISLLSNLYAETKDLSSKDFFEKNLQKIDGFNAMSFYSNYQVLIQEMDFEGVIKAMEKYEKIALSDMQSVWRRFSATRAINDMRNFYRKKANAIADPAKSLELEKKVTQLTGMIDGIIKNEQDDQMKEIYKTRLILIEKSN